MLQMNTGSIWIGQKVMERIREESQASQRRNFLLKLTLDKVNIIFSHNKLFYIFIFFKSNFDIFSG